MKFHRKSVLYVKNRELPTTSSGFGLSLPNRCWCAERTGTKAVETQNDVHERPAAKRTPAIMRILRAFRGHSENRILSTSTRTKVPSTPTPTYIKVGTGCADECQKHTVGGSSRILIVCTTSGGNVSESDAYHSSTVVWVHAEVPTLSLVRSPQRKRPSKCKKECKIQAWASLPHVPAKIPQVVQTQLFPGPVRS